VVVPSASIWFTSCESPAFSAGSSSGPASVTARTETTGSWRFWITATGMPLLRRRISTVGMRKGAAAGAVGRRERSSGWACAPTAETVPARAAAATRVRRASVMVVIIGSSLGWRRALRRPRGSRW
jgi:hypothetical protein